MSQKQVEDIIAMFDIPAEKNEGDSNDYATTAETAGSPKPEFSELVESLGDALEGGKDTITLEVKKPEVKIEQKTEQKSKIEDLIKESISSGSSKVKVDTDDIFVQSSSSKKENVVEDSNIRQAQKEPIIAAEKSDGTENRKEESPQAQEPTPAKVEQETERQTETETEVSQKMSIENSQSSPWLLTSPNEKYNNFYDNKRDTLRLILVDGPIPFDQYNDELRKAHVDLSDDRLDLRVLHELRRDIQQWRVRIQSIAVHCNNQYYMWERFIDLLHGQLARIEYEKPAARQEGLIYQHMRDMEMYRGRLRALHDSVPLVLENLDGASETLSREITTALQTGQTVSNQNKKIEPQVVEVNKTQNQTLPILEPEKSTPMLESELKGYDGIEGNPAIIQIKPKTGSQYIEWDEV